MKTPMQELFDWISDNSHKSMYDGKLFSTELSITDILRKAESLLEKEKALLIKTHGNKKVYDSQIDPTIVTGEEWYDKTFNTKER